MQAPKGRKMLDPAQAQTFTPAAQRLFAPWRLFGP
jgi:hypothetical protein